MVITRVADRHWHALDDDRVVGRGYAEHRPDRPAEAMVAELTACRRRAGFAIRRREWEYAVPTDPRITGLEETLPPSGVTILPAGQADEGLLRAVDRAIRDEVEATAGWRSMPAEVIPHPEDDTVIDPSKYAVAAAPDRYLGLIRVVTVNRPRIGLLAVRTTEQRRGIARALLAHALGTLHRAGFTEALAEVQELNHAATALFEDIGARPMNGNLELVR